MLLRALCGLLVLGLLRAAQQSPHQRGRARMHSQQRKGHGHGQGQTRRPDATARKTQASCHLASMDGLVILPQYKSSFVWKAPMQISCPRGIVLLMQGCDYTGREWWRHVGVPGVNPADALPIESAIALRLLQRGYAVVGLAPHFDRAKSKCWHDNDRSYIARIVRTVRSSFVENSTSSSPTMPLFALGVHKAGSYLGKSVNALALRTNTTFRGIVLMNSGIWHEDFDHSLFPAVMYIDMNRNSVPASHNRRTLLRLAAVGVTAVQHSSDPWPLTETFFHEHGVLRLNCSAALFRAMAADGRYLWPANGLLLVDPTARGNADNLRKLIAQTLPGYLAKHSIDARLSPLAQVLRLAYGFRETNPEFTEQMIDWFDMLRDSPPRVFTARPSRDGQ